MENVKRKCLTKAKQNIAEKELKFLVAEKSFDDGRQFNSI